MTTFRRKMRYAFASLVTGLALYVCVHQLPSEQVRLSVPVHIRARLIAFVEMERFELLTPCLQGRCSPN